uniref:WAP four-disulfide core domain protein 1 n=1 Tax=Petromyzon marinus TaxID=7757 RepID=A0AAJ7TB87_PETMA|nr:WAP four-disulfide core domain protein 1 [Petromyzon marinus]
MAMSVASTISGRYHHHGCLPMLLLLVVVLLLPPSVRLHPGVLEAGPRDVPRGALHLRVVDRAGPADGQDYEAEAPEQQRSDRCPPPPQRLPERACEVASCRANSECGQTKRCCYNGCSYACLEPVPPPPVLDWLVQPKPRWLGGNGWLLDGPEEVLPAEACSTTEDGDVPLQCPTGYECHIIRPGNPALGLPNRGQCVKQREHADPHSYKHRLRKEPSGGGANSAVSYDKTHRSPLGK